MTACELVKPNSPHPNYSASLGEEAIQKLDKLRFSSGPLSTAYIRANLQKSMQVNAGVFRIEKTLKDGCNKIDESLEMFNKVGIKDRVRYLLTKSKPIIFY